MAKQQMVPFGTAIGRFFAKYFNFMGRSSRSEFWFAQLFLLIVGVGISLFMLVLPELYMVLYVTWSLAIIFPVLSLYTRRFRDAGIWPLFFWLPFLLLPVTLGIDIVTEVPVFTILMFLMFLVWSVFTFVVTLLPTKQVAKPVARKRK